MRNYFNILLVLIFPLSLFSQKFGDFNEELLTKEYSSIDSSASSELLFKKTNIFYEFTASGTYIRSETFKRIKVYSEEGIATADIEISHDPKEEIYFTKAISYNLENGEMAKQKLSKKNIYKEKKNESQHTVSFAVPNVKKGSVYEIKISLRTPYIYSIPKFYFQEEVPIVKAVFEMDVPKYFGLNPIATGTIPLDMKEGQASSTSHGEKRFTYTAENVPPIKADKYVLNINDYRSSLRYEISSTAFPNSKIEYYTKDWDQIATNLNESRSFGKQITAKVKGIKEIADSFEGKSEDEKIIACYNYVLENYTWDDYISKYSDKGVAKTFKDKSGDSGELNILLINLLNRCGINTYPYITRIRRYGMFTTIYPSLTNLSYVMACVEKEDGSLVFLDATNSDLPLGQIPLRATNLGGMIIKEGKSIMYDFKNPNNYTSRSLMNFKFDENNELLIGEGNKVVQDFAALNFKNKYENKDDDNYDQNIENNEFEENEEDEEEVDIVYMSNIEGLEGKPGKITFNLSEINKKSVQKIDDKIFLSSTLGYGLDENPFIEESREFPIFYNYKVKIAQVLSVEIPEGYKLESKPEDLAASIESRKVVFRHSITTLNENSLVINIQFQVKDPIIMGSEYEAFKGLFETFLKRSNEKIVLVKI